MFGYRVVQLPLLTVQWVPDMTPSNLKQMISIYRKSVASHEKERYEKQLVARHKANDNTAEYERIARSMAPNDSNRSKSWSYSPELINNVFFIVGSG